MAMQYRADRRGNPISILGYGCMRFSRKGAGVDVEKMLTEVTAAVDAGVNYLDTAYIYPGSEAALGEVMARTGIRDRVNIATKLPPYLVKSISGADRIFDEQLERLRVDRIDYYLMHMLTDVASWQRLAEMGIVDWLERRRAAGQIGQVGFSYHGDTAGFLKILEAHDWDFCQIQYNYLDEHSQAGRRGLMAAAEKGIPVVIMEPLRGGKLAKLPADAQRLVESDGRGWSAAEWAFRWLWDQPQVTCVLSGMNSLEMVEQNCRAASDAHAGDFGQREHDLIEELRDIIGARMKVGCTGCGYCMPCPQGVDIPGTFRCYNGMYIDGKAAGRREYLQAVGLRKKSAFADACVGCGKCERHCPQSLPIRELLKQADRELRPLPYKIAGAIGKRFIVG